MRWAKGSVCAAVIPRLTGSLQVREIKKLWRGSCSPFLKSGMLIWVLPQPNHQFVMQSVSGYLSLEPPAYCWTGLKQASDFSSYSCLLPGWGFQSAGTPGTHSLSFRVPIKHSFEWHKGWEWSLKAAVEAVRGVPVGWCHLGLWASAGYRWWGGAVFQPRDLWVPGITLPRLTKLPSCCGNAKKVGRMLVRVAV